jgi:general secretion pathway protein F
MAVYQYEALNRAGKSIRGIVDAESARMARAKLRGQGLYPTRVEEEGAAGGEGAAGFSLWNRIPPKDLALAFRQLSTLVEAGIPLVSSLSALIDQLGNPMLKKIFTQVREKVREGSSFADALSLFPRVFSNLLIGLVRTGEMSGTLDLALARWADFSEQQVALRERIRAALAYPLFMLVIGVGVLLFLMTFVVPSVTKIFSDLGQALPLPTRILIAVSDFLSLYGWALLIGSVGLSLWLRKWLRRESGAWIWDRWKLRLPLGGGWYRKLAISRWARTLATLLQGGLPLLQALRAAQDVVGNRLIAQALEEARERIREGAEMAFSLRQSGFFPAMVLEMVAVGEKSGELGKMLEKVARNLEGEVEAELRAMISLLEPLMILLMGVGVGFIALSILLPILEMSRMIR